MALYAYEEHSDVNQTNRDLSTSGVRESEFFTKKFTYSFTSASHRRAEDEARERERGWRVRKRGRGEKSVCFFTALDFIFESIFFAPTVTHC